MAPLVAFALTGDLSVNSRALRQVRSLANSDFQIHALSLTSNNRPVTEKLIPNVTVTWISMPPTSGPSFFWRWHRTLSAHLKQINAQLFHASDLYSLPACANEARRRQARCSYDARELYPHVAATIGRPLVSAFWKNLERRYIRSCDAVFTVSPSIANYLSQNYRIPVPTIVENVPNHSSLAHPKKRSGFLRRETNTADSQIIIVHQGQLRKHRGCETLVEAAQLTDGRAVFVFLGDGPLRSALRDLAARSPASNRIHFLDPVPPDELLAVTAGGDIGVTLLEDVCLNHRFALPNKLFEYLAAGLPVLGSDLPEIGRVIKQFDVGLLCKPGDPEDTANTLNRMTKSASDRARWSDNTRKVLETFNWPAASQRLVEGLRAALDS